jgi:hypothetical protein
LVTLTCLEIAVISSEFRISGHANIRRVSAGRNAMKRFYASCAIAAAVALGGWASVMPANAAPPTVTPSPGYDARLQEQRAATAPVIYEPVIRPGKPVSRRHVNRPHVRRTYGGSAY